MNNLKKLLVVAIAFAMMLLVACNKQADKKAEVKEETKAETKAEEKKEEKTEAMPEEKKDDHDHDDHDHDDHDHDHDHDHEELSPEDVSLALWKGDWNSLDAYYDDPVVKEAVEKAAKEKNITAEEFIKNVDVRRHSDYKGLHIDEEGVTFYDGKVGEGKVIATAKYKLKEILEVEHGSKTLNWFVFETDSKDVKPLLALMQIHGEEHMAHYHTRYADSIDEIKDAESKWYPTFIRTSTSSEDVAEELTE